MNAFTKMINKLKDPGSAITHGIGMAAAVVASVPLIAKAYDSKSLETTTAVIIFIVSMIFLYAASTAYHSFDISPKVNKVLKKKDHIMIYILIAGTYTPVCAIVLGDRAGWIMLAAVWGIAAAGILISALWISCPKAFSSAVYIAMGWICVFAITRIIAALPRPAFMWLLAGGILYTIGGVIYALKLPIFKKLPRSFGAHEIFHIFVMCGSICHYVLVYRYVA